MLLQTEDINHLGLKLLSVPPTLVASFTWGGLASILSCVWFTLLILDFLWKKVVKPLIRYYKPDFLSPTVKGNLDE